MSNKSVINAIAVFNAPKCKGTVLICEKPGSIIEFEVNLSNLKPGKHGFHIHEAGNLSEGCKSCCSHFNPLGAKHGGLQDKNHSRHLGDLGNITADKRGNCREIIQDKSLKLRGAKFNIIGRSIVVHADPDDLGKGGDEESLKTGNAGARIGCAVIGYKTGYYF
jgi:Cu-Zn family superoxide dismutase